jgi:hypothetical protein
MTGRKWGTLRPEDRKRQAAFGQAVEETVTRQPKQERLPRLNSGRVVVETQATPRSSVPGTAWRWPAGAVGSPA